MNPRHAVQLLGGRGTRPPRKDRATHSVSDLRRAARRRLPRAVFDYLEGGAEQERTLQDNQARYETYRFHPRALTGTSAPTLHKTLFGRELPLPLGLAPTGYTRLIHRDGEIGVARAAGQAGVPYTAATMATTALAEIAASSGGPLWFQLYVNAEWRVTERLVEDAGQAGCQALLVSVDTQVAGQRLRDLRNGFTIPPALSWSALLGIALRPRYWTGLLGGPELEFANFPDMASPSAGGIAEINKSFEAALSWQHLERIRKRWTGPLLLKGPLGPADVAHALASGCDGVYLSNHGGRQLDRSPHPLDLLLAARREVGEAAPLLVDSGIRTGADAVIALALGADLAMVGRAYLYGLAAAGERGVRLAISTLADEMERTMQLLGVGGVAELRRLGTVLVARDGGRADVGDRG
ncbi:MAG: alpha-hydroxy acid oxidase [Candidatus Dormibacteria bacterium]